MTVGLRDSGLDLLRKRVYVPAIDFAWAVGAYTDFSETAADADSGGLGVVVTTNVLSADTAANADQEIAIPAAGVTPVNGTGPYGFILRGLGIDNPWYNRRTAGQPSGFTCITAGGAGTGTDFDYHGMVPYDLDTAREVGARVYFRATSTTATDTVTWVTAVTSNTDSEIPTDGATAPDTASAARALTAVANGDIFRTARDIYNAANAGLPAVADWFWSWHVRLSAVSNIAATSVDFLGLEIDYMPRLTFGAGKGLSEAVLTDPFGTA